VPCGSDVSCHIGFRWIGDQVDVGYNGGRFASVGRLNTVDVTPRCVDVLQSSQAGEFATTMLVQYWDEYAKAWVTMRTQTGFTGGLQQIPLPVRGAADMAPTGEPTKADLLQNPFLDFDNTAEALPRELWRPRAVSDLTDTRLPLKVELPSDAGLYQIGRNRLGSSDSGDGLGVSLATVKEDSLPAGFCDFGPPFRPGSSGCFGVSSEAGPVPGIPLPSIAHSGLRNQPVNYAAPLHGAGHDFSDWGSCAGSSLPPAFGPGVARRTRDTLAQAQARAQAPSSVLGHGYWGRNAAAAEQRAFFERQAAASLARGPHLSLLHHLGGEVDAEAGLSGASNFHFSEPLRAPGICGLGDTIGGGFNADFITPPPGFDEGGLKAPQTTAPLSQAEPITVMLRNIPNSYTQNMLLQLLEDQGFRGLYDFVYLPMDFRNGVNLGYAFVNLTQHSEALKFMNAFGGLCSWKVESTKICEVSWAHPHQGLLEHVERYRNSPVMHPRMPDEYKPMVFCDGVRVAFPGPTKAIKAPKLRLTRERLQQGMNHQGVGAAPGLVAPVA
jgi:hypothetical protein